MTTGMFARSVVGALGLLVAFASSGYAGSVLYHGSLCNQHLQNFSGSNINLAGYDQFGVRNGGSATNTSNITAIVSCGAAIEGGSLIQAVTVIVYDRNM